MAENVYEIRLTATDAQNNTHTVDIEAKLPADTPKAAVSKIVEACMDQLGSGRFKDAEATR